MNQITKTIYHQIGGNKFAVMTGAKFIITKNPNELQIKFKGSKKANFLTITLDPVLDTYELVFSKLARYDIKEIKSFYGVYGDDLQHFFTLFTGLDTRL